MSIRIGYLIVLFIATIKLNAQNSLDKYIELGIKNNIALQQKNVSLEKALYSLKTANSLFFPSVELIGDYQSGKGGRQIEIPFGDMLNPVYGTLNQLTMSNSFPQISNVEASFLPENFYDAKVRISMPLFNNDLLYNRNIQKKQIVLQECEVEIYKSELTKSIKVAYYNYLSASKSVSIYESFLNLAKEGKRINESLVENGKSLKAYVLRSESEIQDLEAKKTSALQQKKNTQLYFNFLINEDPYQTIDTMAIPDIDLTTINNYLLNDPDLSNRTELKSLEISTAMFESILRKDKNYWLPKLNVFLDLGSQDEDWRFDDKSRYYFVGLHLEVPIFSAGRNNYKIKQSELEVQNQMLNKSNVNKQISLSANIIKNSLRESYENYLAGLKQLDAASAYYKLIEKGYKEGISTFIETIDARNQLTTATLQVVISKYQLLGAVASYEREISK